MTTPTRDAGHQPAEPLESAERTVGDIVNALFAVGLDLAAVRALVSPAAGARLDRAILELDLIISDVRSCRSTMAATASQYRAGEPLESI